MFLYKDNKLVTPLAEGYELTIDPQGDYDQLAVIENGLAGNITLKDNGVLTAYAGAIVIGVNQSANGKLRFDYSAGDTTIITGLNAHGSFVVQNDELWNVCGENVNLSGKVKVVDYHSLGVFTAADGVDISGNFTVSGSGKAYFKNGTTIHDCTIAGSNINFEAGVGIWGQQAIPTVISMLFFWPVLITQIWGMVEQSKLDDKALEIAEGVIATNNSNTIESAPAMGHKFCTSCGTKNIESANFCCGCGKRL